MLVISLTTIPQRLPYIEPVLDSLIAQGFPVYLWVPQYARGMPFVKAPPFLDKVRWSIVEDQGPLTKLLPALQFDQIITADDDTIYGPGWAHGLIQWSTGDSVIAYRGRIWKPGSTYRSSRIIRNPTTPTRVDLVTGCCGALYERTFFDDLIYRNQHKCPTNDDLVISASITVPIYVVPCSCTFGRHLSASRNALGIENSRHLNDKGLKALWP